MNLNRDILKLAGPNIISNITIPLVGMIDVAVMGRMESEVYIGAIALGGMIFNIIYWGFGFLRMGTTGFTAQAYGANAKKEIPLILGRSAMIAAGIGIILIMLQWPVAKLSFWILDNSDPEVLVHARKYFMIRIWAAPASLLLLSFNGWFIGMQNSIIPTIIAVSVSLINLGANLFFIYVKGMTSDGVALGTVIAQYSGLLLALIFFAAKYRHVLKDLILKNIPERKGLKSFMAVNSDIFIRSLSLLAVFSFFTAESSAIGKTELAVNTILLQFFIFFSYFIDGFAYAGEALTGKAIGMKDESRLKNTIRKLFYWGAGLSIPYTLVYVVGGTFLVRMLTNNLDVIDSAQPYLFWIGLVPILSFAAFIWDGVYIGATASAPMRNAMLLSAFVIFFPIYYGCKFLIPELGLENVPFYESHALWLAFVAFMLSRGLGLSVLARKSILIKE